MEPLEPRSESTCPACGGLPVSPGTLCSAACVRAAVHEIEDLSLRRRRLAEDLESREDRSTLERLDPRNRGDGGALRDEHDRVATRTNQLMAALLATDRSALSGHASRAETA